MNDEHWAAGMFRAIDAKDADAFSRYLSDDVRFRFANAPPVHGRDAVREAVAGFFSSIAGLRHDLTDVWDLGDDVLCHGEVTYERHDAITLQVPFAVVLRMAGEQVRDYAILVDASALYAPG